VVTFCRDEATPIAAEEGLTGKLSSGGDIKGYGDLSAFTEDEVILIFILECIG
jgi:AP endonuclease-2